jgi:hypothetical protein
MRGTLPADKEGMVSAAQSRLIEAELAPKAIATQISGAIAAKSHESEKQEGAAVLQLLDQAANVGNQVNQTGRVLDVSA